MSLHETLYASQTFESRERPYLGVVYTFPFSLNIKYYSTAKDDIL